MTTSDVVAIITGVSVQDCYTAVSSMNPRIVSYGKCDTVFAQGPNEARG